MNNKALRLFGEAFLRTLVIVLGLLIIGFAIFFLVKVVTTGNNTNNQSKAESTMDEDALQQQLDDENATAEDATGADSTQDATAEAPADATSEEPTSEEPATEAPAVSSKDLKIAVLNSTGQKGLAGAWVDKLKAAGYTKVYAGNYKIGQLAASKVLAVSEGNGSDLVSLFKGATLETGNLTSGYNLVDATVTTTDIDIFIIIGTDDNIVQ